MSRLLIIRHGQASFGAADYDQLSPLGYRQSEKLGSYIAEKKINIDAVYHGPAKRHQQTLDTLKQSLLRGGRSIPEAECTIGLDEFPALELVAMRTDDRSTETFISVCQDWMCGTLDSGALETANDFYTRVHAALLSIGQKLKQEETALIVTSGGPTAMAMQAALGLTPQKTNELLWIVANSALTELRYTNGQLSLHSFNSIAHLSQEDITFR